MMKRKSVLFLLLLLIGGAAHYLHAQPLATQSLVVTGLNAPGNCFCDRSEGLFGKKKKRHKAKIFAVGAVAGAPVGLGGRVIIRPTRLAIAGDIAYNRLRNDNGVMTSAIVSKIDARLYSKGVISKLLRPYLFTGVTFLHGKFNQVSPETVFSLDTGVGAGVKLWHLEVNAEAGLLLPARKIETYQPGIGVFANVGVMWWLF